MENKNIKIKEKRVYRNYCNDTAQMYKEIYTAICDCFDEEQDSIKKQNSDVKGIPYNTLYGFVHKRMRGTVNPMVLMKVLKEYEI